MQSRMLLCIDRSSDVFILALLGIVRTGVGGNKSTRNQVGITFSLRQRAHKIENTKELQITKNDDRPSCYLIIYKDQPHSYQPRRIH